MLTHLIVLNRTDVVLAKCFLQLAEFLIILFLMVGTILFDFFDISLVILYFQIEIDIFFCLILKASFADNFIMVLVIDGELVHAGMAFDAAYLSNIQ